MPAKKTTETVKKTNDEVPEVPVVKKTRAKKTTEAPTETPVEVVKKSRAKKTVEASAPEASAPEASAPEASTKTSVEVVKKSKGKKNVVVAPEPVTPEASEASEPEAPDEVEASEPEAPDEVEVPATPVKKSKAKKTPETAPEVPATPAKKSRAKKVVPDVEVTSSTPVVDPPSKKPRAKKTTEKPKNDDDELSDALLEKLLEAKKTEWADITKQISNLNAEREKLSVLQQTLLNELHDLMNKIKKEPTDNTFVLEKKETKNLLSMNHISDSDTDSSPNSDDESDSETFNKSVLANKQPVKGKKLISKVNSDSESD
jgi:hypothetical protein